MTAAAAPRRLPRPGLPGPLGRLATGIGAVAVKELRGRMRGRRAFVVLTIYLLLLAGLAWAIEVFLERTMAFSFGMGSSSSAVVGRGVFIGLMLFETMLVTLLAPAFTAGAISLEREKQTLDLLVATPISSLGIVLGKLLSALTYVFLLIAASLPLTALVFMFGGVGPDDLVRGYLVLLVTALGFGTVGLFCSALLKRTQAATVVTYVVVLALTFGSVLLWGFWTTMVQETGGAVVTRDVVIQRSDVIPPGLGAAADGSGATSDVAPPDQTGVVLPRRAPAALLWLNPFVAQVDVFCGTETSLGGTCAIIAEIEGRSIEATGGPIPMPAPVVPGQPLDDTKGGVGAGSAPAVGDVPAVDPIASFRDTFWPVFAAAWILGSVVLVVIAVQLVSPTRRWRLPRRRVLHEPPAGTPPPDATTVSAAATAPAGPLPPPGGTADGGIGRGGDG